MCWCLTSLFVFGPQDLFQSNFYFALENQFYISTHTVCDTIALQRYLLYIYSATPLLFCSRDDRPSAAVCFHYPFSVMFLPLQAFTDLLYTSCIWDAARHYAASARTPVYTWVPKTRRLDYKVHVGICQVWNMWVCNGCFSYVFIYLVTVYRFELALFCPVSYEHLTYLINLKGRVFFSRFLNRDDLVTTIFADSCNFFHRSNQVLNPFSLFIVWFHCQGDSTYLCICMGGWVSLYLFCTSSFQFLIFNWVSSPLQMNRSSSPCLFPSLLGTLQQCLPPLSSFF